MGIARHSMAPEDNTIEINNWTSHNQPTYEIIQLYTT